MGFTDKLSAIIVNYRTPDLTRKCVASLREWGLVADDQIIVVDNASPDDSLVRMRLELGGTVKVIDAGRNGGFSFGINVGLREVRNEYVLVLNPDTYFVDGSIEKAIALLDSSLDVGLVGLDLVYPDGRRQFSARRFYSVLDIVGRRLPIGKYWPVKGWVDKHMMYSAWEGKVPFEADWVMGTGFIIRRSLFEQIGGMDEAYFLYMEDVDLCARVWAAGSKVICVPGATLIHDHQRSSASGPLSWAGKMHLKSLKLFAKKYRLPLFVAPNPHNVLRDS